jgi:hypothetical protein
MSGYTSQQFADSLLKLVFNSIAITNIADNAAIAPLTNLYVALHTADPTNAGNQAANEASYTGYARVAVQRTSAGFTINANQISNTAATIFNTCTAGSNLITHASVGVANAGATEILYAGPVSSPLTVSVGVTPQFAAGQLAWVVN